MKKSTLFVGFLVAAFTVPSAAPTNNVVDSFTASTQGEGIITPMAVDNEIVNSQISGSSYTKNFNIQANFG
ncbi:hypothetical protein [Paenibacillus sp. 1A_MP2]|uniref:hypothetical protein n=1 Tax=Paenibacillus sp. 1A_MP2 TaxID=3457495 RepID=UPI003FCC9B29